MTATPFYKQIYFGNRFYHSGLLVVLVFIICWLLKWPFEIGVYFTLLYIVLFLVDFIFLFYPAHKFTSSRNIANRLSNSDYNPVILTFWHNYPVPLRVQIIEELPEQFQARTNTMERKIPGATRYSFTYKLRPVERGDYEFGNTVCLISSPLGLAQRRLLGAEPVAVKVYPSFLQMRQFSLMAKTAQTEEQGLAKVRKLGHSLEFEHIKDYVLGDDMRALNWKATARKGNLMVNHYIDERSQQVYCLIDKGRLMKMPFNGLSLMDYAINSTLVLGSVALHRQDRFGLISFSHRYGDFLPADRKPGQLKMLQEALYRINTEFYESDYEKFYLQVRKIIKQRSLLILFTNFESTTGMRRQLPYLRQLARHHLLLVVFFENTELAALSNNEAHSLEDVYTNTIAGKFVFEKRMMVKELQQHGILSLLTPPEQLTVQTVNKYVELKTRQAI